MLLILRGHARKICLQVTYFVYIRVQLIPVCMQLNYVDSQLYDIMQIRDIDLRDQYVDMHLVDIGKLHVNISISHVYVNK